MYLYNINNIKEKNFMNKIVTNKHIKINEYPFLLNWLTSLMRSVSLVNSSKCIDIWMEMGES